MSIKLLSFLVTLALVFSGWQLEAGETDVKSTTVPPSSAALTAPAKAIEPGHSLHGETFDEGPRQKAYLMGGTGDVHFPVTTRVPLAQQFFDQGVGQLHGFWYFEAERSFRQVAALDPDCAMAYWGMALANDNNEKRAKGFIEKAVQKRTGASPREVAWIDALSAALAGSDSAERRRKYVRALESIVQDNPNDVDAKAFLALQIWKNGSWMTESKKQLPISSYQAVDSILDQVFQVQPMHPAHHFRIHLWDEEKAARALVSASLCGQTSPAIAHMWHMPGHIYSKLHRYTDAAWQQEASARVDHAQMMRDGLLPDQIHNYAHNNEWLIRNLAFLGRVHDAIDLATNMLDLPRHPKFNTPEKGSANFGHDRLTNVLVQYECWKEILAYDKTAYFAPVKNNTNDKLDRSRMIGLAWFGQGNLDEGRKQIVAVGELLKEKRTARYAAADEAEAKARKDKKADRDVAKAMADAMTSFGSDLQRIERVVAELKGHAALGSNDLPSARGEFEKLKDAGSIRKDHLARTFSLCGDNAQAESLARAAVEKGPGEVYPLAVLVDVLYRAGKKPESQAEFAKLRTLAAFADLDMPVFARLKPVAQELNLPADWRGSLEPAADVGQRPELANLGPFRWQPTPAVSWTVAGADGSAVSLDQFRGKPVIVIFYLGSGCLHCVEQLQKFSPLKGEFAGAGISIVAISSEPLDSLKGSVAKLSAKEPISFPLAADPELNVFRSYRCYDDFEKMPLHGTFLIDAEGLVRWQDISYEPFLNPKFLLDEAKRLLGR